MKSGMKRVVVAISSVALSLPLVAISSGSAEAAAACTHYNGHLYATSGSNQLIVDLPSTGSGNVHCVLGTSSYRIATVTLQGSLRACYGKNIETDGIFGSQTRAALRQVQSAIGVEVDGVYGPQTGAKMKHVVHYGAVSSNPGAFHSCHAVPRFF